jgi:phospholipid/cholesterol/gamma-HCH transport system substrate-binding protein
MSRESHALLAGLFVLMLGAALVTAGIWLGNYGREYDTYVLTTQSAVSGLRPESTVYFRGVEAGKVAAIEFDPKDPQTIRVYAQLDKGLPITTRTFARLRVQPLTGLAQIELDKEAGDAAPLPTSKNMPAVIPMRPSLLDELAGTGQGLLGQLEQLAMNLNDLFDETTRHRIQQIFHNVETATAQLNRLEQRMDKALAQVPAVGADARKTLGRFDQLSDDLQALSHRLTLFTEEARQLVGAGKATGDHLTRGTLPRLDALLDELRTTTQQVGRLTTLLENDPQSLLLGPAPRVPGPGERGYQEP